MKTIFFTAILLPLIVSNTMADIANGNNSPSEDTAHLNSQAKEWSDGYNSAETFYEIGSWLAIGGLAASFLPQLDNPDGKYDGIIGWGGIAFLVGIPMMGAESNKMKNFTLKREKGYEPPSSGLAYYYWGTGFKVLGIALLTVQGIDGAVSILTGDESPVDLSEAIGGAFLAGFGLDFYSWYKFHKLRQSTLKFSGPITLSPMVMAGKEDYAYGLILRGRF